MILQPIPMLPADGATQEEWGLYNGIALMHRQVAREDAEDAAKASHRQAMEAAEVRKAKAMEDSAAASTSAVHAGLIVNAAIELLVDRTTTTTSAATMASEIVKCAGYAKAVVDAVQALLNPAPVPQPGGTTPPGISG